MTSMVTIFSNNRKHSTPPIRVVNGGLHSCFSIFYVKRVERTKTGADDCPALFPCLRKGLCERNLTIAALILVKAALLHHLILSVVRIGVQLLDLADQRITRIRSRTLIVERPFGKTVQVRKKLLLVHPSILDRMR